MFLVKEWLDNAAKGKSDEKTRLEDHKIRGNFQGLSESLKLEALLGLVDDMHKAKSKVDLLAQQKTNLGLK
jgi:hypothetical protein